jgi:hypothetical protein
MSAGMAQPGEIARAAADRPRHVVHFYGHDDELAGSLAGHLGEALEAGAAVVMLATPAHREACERRMAAAGADVAAAAASGAYVAVDAASLMRRVLADGGFDELISGVLRQVTGGGRPAVVYGEIVARLWAAGLAGAAIELESWWNELGRSYSFSLVCGYPAQAAAAGPLDRVCGLHSSVIGSPVSGRSAVRGFLAARGAPRAARHFAADTLRAWGEPWGDSPLAVDAAIVAAELTANAVLHARSDFTIALSRRAGVVRIEVSDCAPLDGSLLAAAGHGLDLVSMVARWGARPRAGGGKLVWAELPGPARTQPAVSDS